MEPPLRSRSLVDSLVALLVAALLFAACGSDSTPVASGSAGAEATPTPAPAVPDEGSEGTDGAAPDGKQEGTVIGTANLGGEIVDPVRHAIDDVAVLESYPEQLAISFTAGAEPCLAATATATGTDTQVIVTLDVGITTDALAKSCLAGEFGHSLTIALTEGLDGREVVLAPGEERPPVGEPPAQAFETTLIGLSEQAAEEAAADFGYGWRVVHRDGEEFAVTMDFVEDRINATIIDGVVTDAFLG